MKKALLLIIPLVLLVSCSTGPKVRIHQDWDPSMNSLIKSTQALSKSIEALDFYTQIMMEMGEAVDVLLDESLPVEQRLFLYQMRMDFIDMRINQFRAMHE